MRLHYVYRNASDRETRIRHADDKLTRCRCRDRFAGIEVNDQKVGIQAGFTFKLASRS
jgi:hypothetical protein